MSQGPTAPGPRRRVPPRRGPLVPFGNPVVAERPTAAGDSAPGPGQGLSGTPAVCRRVGRPDGPAIRGVARRTRSPEVPSQGPSAGAAEPRPHPASPIGTAFRAPAATRPAARLPAATQGPVALRPPMPAAPRPPGDQPVAVTPPGVDQRAAAVTPPGVDQRADAATLVPASQAAAPIPAAVRPRAGVARRVAVDPCQAPNWERTACPVLVAIQPAGRAGEARPMVEDRAGGARLLVGCPRAARERPSSARSGPPGRRATAARPAAPATRATARHAAAQASMAVPPPRATRPAPPGRWGRTTTAAHLVAATRPAPLAVAAAAAARRPARVAAAPMAGRAPPGASPTAWREEATAAPTNPSPHGRTMSWSPWSARPPPVGPLRTAPVPAQPRQHLHPRNQRQPPRPESRRVPALLASRRA
jgi:hypothetical protein